MDDRPTPPDGDDHERFRLLDDDIDSPTRQRSESEGTESDAADEIEERRPFRARDLLDDPAPDEFGAVPVIDPNEPVPGGDSDANALPHWTDPPTGEVPRIFSSGDDELAPWATLSTSQPRWRDQSSGWDETDISSLGEDLPRIGLRDDSAASEEFFTFDDEEAPPDPFSVPRDPTDPHGRRNTDPYASGREAPVGRNIGLAAVVGAGMAVAALVLFSIGPAAVMALVVVILVLASAELMSTMRRVGYSPPALVGLAAGASLPLASYWKGESGLVLAVVLTTVVCLLWYLLGIGTEHAVPNIGVTLLTVGYVGVLGSFAALILRSPHGTGLLLAAILGPIFYDIAGLFIGRSIGRSPLSSASPNKTIEGTIGGMAVAFLVTWVGVGGIIGSGITPFNSAGEAFILAVVLAIVAPIGDLCESMLKRDLGVKDMGTILPGHGGVLDRFDAMLFALPATYYVAQVVL